MVKSAMLRTKQVISLKSVGSILLAALFLLLFSATSVLALQRLSVKVGLANVRSGPSKHSKVVWQVTKYHPFLILKKKGDWYECKDFEGDCGWLYKGLLVKSESVITLKNNCNVRSGPGSKNKVIFIVDREVPLKVLKHKGRWLKIRHEDGDEGWIHASLVW